MQLATALWITQHTKWVYFFYLQVLYILQTHRHVYSHHGHWPILHGNRGKVPCTLTEGTHMHEGIGAFSGLRLHATVHKRITRLLPAGFPHAAEVGLFRTVRMAQWASVRRHSSHDSCAGVVVQASPVNEVMVQRADPGLLLDFSPFESTQTTLANVFAATFLPPEVR